MQLHVKKKKKLSIASSQPTGPEIIERRRLTLTHFQLQKTPGLLQILKKKKKKRQRLNPSSNSYHARRLPFMRNN